MKSISTEKEVSHPMLSPTPPTSVKRGKILSAEEAIKVIRDAVKKQGGHLRKGN